MLNIVPGRGTPALEFVANARMLPTIQRKPALLTVLPRELDISVITPLQLTSLSLGQGANGCSFHHGNPIWKHCDEPESTR